MIWHVASYMLGVIAMLAVLIVIVWIAEHGEDIMQTIMCVAIILSLFGGMIYIPYVTGSWLIDVVQSIAD